MHGQSEKAAEFESRRLPGCLITSTSTALTGATMRLNRRQRTRVTASVLTASVSLCAVAAAARGEESESASTASDRWTPPGNYHYDPHSSFRGLTADGKVENYDVSGHAYVGTRIRDGDRPR